MLSSYHEHLTATVCRSNHLSSNTNKSLFPILNIIFMLSSYQEHQTATISRSNHLSSKTDLSLFYLNFYLYAILRSGTPDCNRSQIQPFISKYRSYILLQPALLDLHIICLSMYLCPSITILYNLFCYLFNVSLNYSTVSSDHSIRLLSSNLSLNSALIKFICLSSFTCLNLAVTYVLLI